MLMETPHTHNRAVSTLGLLVRCDTQHATLHTAQHAMPSTDVSVTFPLCLFGPNFQVKIWFSNKYFQYFVQ